LLPDASTKFQENVSGGTTTSSEGVQSSSSNSEGNRGAAHTAKSSNSTAEGAGESSAQTGESFAAAARKTVYTTVSQGLQTATASAHAAFQKVREAKVVDSIKTSYSFLREELSNTQPRRKARAAPDTGPPPAENTEVTAVVPVVKKTTGWEKRWETLKEKVLRKKLYASHLLSFLGCVSGLLFLILHFSQMYLMFVSCLM
jgi:import inner membrane translocase subunit TIM44